MRSPAISSLSLLFGFFFATSLAATDNECPVNWEDGPNKDYSANPSCSIGQTISFTRDVGPEDAELSLWQDTNLSEPRAGGMTVIEESMSVEKYTWTVSYGDSDPNYNNVYYLRLRKGDVETRSHYFNITEPSEESPTTTASSTKTSAPTSSAEPQTTTETVTSDDGGGLSTGAIAGIAVGVVAGVLILAGGLGWMWWARKKRNQEEKKLAELATEGQHSPVKEPPMQQYHETYGNQVYEAPSRDAEPPVYEADGVPVHR